MEYQIPVSLEDYTKKYIDTSIKTHDYGKHKFNFVFDDVSYDYAVLKFRRFDGEVIVYNLESNDFVLNGAEIDVAGYVLAEISCYDSEGRITTNTFEFIVYSDIDTDNSTENNPKVPILDKLIKDTKSAESARIKAETDRVNSEADRIKNETERKESENKRKEVEDLRISEEKYRKNEEYARQENETHRIDAEKERTVAETIRGKAEDIRTSNDEEREANEGIRQSAENTRIKAELQRGSAETERKSAEEARKTAEDLRVSSETERAAKFSQIETKFSEYDKNFNTINEKSNEIINTASGKSVVLHDSDEAHFKDIEISDETNADVTVNVYGKNIFGYISPVMANGTVIESLENGAIVQGNQVGETSLAAAYMRGWFRSGETSKSADCPRLFKGQTVTISADITLMEIGNSPSPYLFGILLLGRPGKGYTGKSITLDQTIGTKQRVSVTYTIGNTASGEIFYPVFTVNSNKMKIENIQIEINSVATEYEEYKNQSVTLTLPLTDTQKEQFRALSTCKGSTTVLNDKNIEMSIGYKADTKLYIDKKFSELQSAIISLGGNV